MSEKLIYWGTSTDSTTENNTACYEFQVLIKVLTNSSVIGTQTNLTLLFKLQPRRIARTNKFHHPSIVQD